MDDELERLINTLIEGVECYLCGSSIKIRADGLRNQSDELYVADYHCPGCDVGYEIEVQDGENTISFKAFRKDIDEEGDRAEISRSTRKESLQRQSHPASDLVDNTRELAQALIILFENQQRLQEAANTVREEGFRQNDEFHRKVKADLHNYMASAYSFDEIVDTIDPRLPTDTNVESAKEQFKDEHQVIKGLRTYAQHHLSLPFSLSKFHDDNTEQRTTTITVLLDDVADYNYKDPGTPYNKVEGDHINVERRVNLHYNAAKNLVGEMCQYVEATHEDELKHFDEVTSYPEIERL